MEPITEAVDATQYLTFRIGGEEYAADILCVREVIEYEEVTTVPAAPASVRGVINLRGHVVPVIDLAVMFGMPPTQTTKRTCIVIVESRPGEQQAVIGVMVDEVCQVMALSRRDVEAPPTFGTRIESTFLSGLGKVDGKGSNKFVLILDLERVLSTEELLARRHGQPPGEELRGEIDVR